ncbi:MAG: hypothetical protein CMI60_01475 [Parvibaculum sp.]|nr:hypothetical protein [Parvibaculum sp.]
MAIFSGLFLIKVSEKGLRECGGKWEASNLRQKLAEFEIFQHLDAIFMRHLGQESIGTLMVKAMGVLDGMIRRSEAVG